MHTKNVVNNYSNWYVFNNNIIVIGMCLIIIVIGMEEIRDGGLKIEKNIDSFLLLGHAPWHQIICHKVTHKTCSMFSNPVAG